MKISPIVFCIVLALFIAIVNATSGDDDKVIKLTESNFDSIIKGNDYTLVKFFAPWCGHCKSLAEPYKLAAEKLSTTKNVKIGEIDCTLDTTKSLCGKYKVQGYPTLLGFTKDGQQTEYDDGRTTDAIVSHVLSAVLPPVTIIKSSDELKAFKNGPLELKLVINTKEGTKLATIVDEVSKNLRKVTAIAIDTTNDNDDGKVTLYRTFDEPEVILKESGDKVTGTILTKFVQQHSLPLIGEIGPHNYKKYVDKNLPLMWLFIDNDDSDQVKVVELLKPIAKDASEVLSFAKVDGKKWSKHAKSFGLESSTPGVVIEDRTSKKKFLYPLDIDSDHKFDFAGLSKFVQLYRDGKLSPAIKSEELPNNTTVKDQLQLPLTTIVGKSYDEVVLDETKDVFVKFYAPWCGHCKAMVPTFEELGEKFKDDDNVIIGNFNASDNDSPLDISGYPTLYFFPASKGGKKEPIQYKGERSVEGISEFITKHRLSKVGNPKTGSSTSSSTTTTTTTGNGKEEL